MKVKLDENLPTALADLLRSAKYDVATADEENLGGAIVASTTRTAL